MSAAHAALAGEAAGRLFKQFRNDGANDAKTFMVSAVAVLQHYPKDVIAEVTHPYSGLASKQQWLPTIFEIRTACEAEMAPRRRAAQHEKVREETLRLRLEDELLEHDRATRPDLEELQAAKGEHFGLTPPPDDPAIRDPTVTDRRLESERRKMLAEYAHLNQDPVYAVPGMLVSPSLVRLMKDQPRPQRDESG